MPAQTKERRIFMEQKLYYNGTILTMADDEGIVEAVLTEDDTILYAGSLEMAKKSCVSGR